mmetsp:Transcript_102979/g.266291  ORF Transcript_102979/g.266291 Transcript_102979/m.266291 type:complete len:252 (+) Transcript_102979:1495-2250(+)
MTTKWRWFTAAWHLRPRPACAPSWPRLRRVCKCWTRSSASGQNVCAMPPPTTSHASPAAGRMRCLARTTGGRRTPSVSCDASSRGWQWWATSRRWRPSRAPHGTGAGSRWNTAATSAPLRGRRRRWWTMCSPSTCRGRCRTTSATPSKRRLLSTCSACTYPARGRLQACGNGLPARAARASSICVSTCNPAARRLISTTATRTSRIGRCSLGRTTSAHGQRRPRRAMLTEPSRACCSGPVWMSNSGSCAMR